MSNMKTKKKAAARMDSNRVRFRKGESQMQNMTYVYRWTDKEGQRHAIYSKTLDELRQKEELAADCQRDGIEIENKKYTVNYMFALWSDLKRGVKDNTLQNYLYLYKQFVSHSFGNRRIADVRKSDVRQFYNSLMDNAGLKTSTLDSVHNIIHQIFQIAVDDNIIRSNPADNVMRDIKKIRGGDTVKREALSVDQQKLFLEYILNTPQYEHWYPVFFIMCNTGMRVGELTGLRWCDIDLENGIISINHTLVYYNHSDAGCFFGINTPKTKAGYREIPMTQMVKDAFIKEKEYQELAKLESKSVIDGYEDFIFINRFGDVHNQSTLNRALARIARNCNLSIMQENKSNDKDVVLLPHFSCHHLRHTFATRLCESGISVKTIQSILGHHDIRTTLDTYVSVTDATKKRDISAFERYLEGEMEMEDKDDNE